VQRKLYFAVIDLVKVFSRCCNYRGYKIGCEKLGGKARLINAVVAWYKAAWAIVRIILLSCAKSHMLSASRRQPHLLLVSAVDRRKTWSMDQS